MSSFLVLVVKVLCGSSLTDLVLTNELLWLETIWKEKFNKNRGPLCDVSQIMHIEPWCPRVNRSSMSQSIHIFPFEIVTSLKLYPLWPGNPAYFRYYNNVFKPRTVIYCILYFLHITYALCNVYYAGALRVKCF